MSPVIFAFKFPARRHVGFYDVIWLWLFHDAITSKMAAHKTFKRENRRSKIFFVLAPKYVCHVFQRNVKQDGVLNNLTAIFFKSG